MFGKVGLLSFQKRRLTVEIQNDTFFYYSPPCLEDLLSTKLVCTINCKWPLQLPELVQHWNYLRYLGDHFDGSLHSSDEYGARVGDGVVTKVLHHLQYNQIKIVKLGARKCNFPPLQEIVTDRPTESQGSYISYPTLNKVQNTHRCKVNNQKN